MLNEVSQFSFFYLDFFKIFFLKERWACVLVVHVKWGVPRTGCSVAVSHPNQPGYNTLYSQQTTSKHVTHKYTNTHGNTPASCNTLFSQHTTSMQVTHKHTNTGLHKHKHRKTFACYKTLYSHTPLPNIKQIQNTKTHLPATTHYIS